MHTPKKVYELFILYEYLQYSHLQLTVSKTETGTDETPHLYICSSSSDPRDQCFAAGSWGDWTTNVGSVLWLHPIGHVCSTDFGGTGPAGLGCTAVLLYMI